MSSSTAEYAACTVERYVPTQAPPSEEDLAMLAQVLNDITRRKRLSPDDSADFAQAVHLRLLERNYDVFHRFARRSSLRTFLTVVVGRLLVDFRRSMYGKWRASSTAVRLGRQAVTLERLIHRDGWTLGEAVEIAAADRAALPVAELRALAEQLPVRHRRRRVPEEVLLNTSGPDPMDPIAAAERRVVDRHVTRALQSALLALPLEDRWLVEARYTKGRAISLLARELRTDPKLLYRRYEGVLRTLRQRLTAAGVTTSSAIETCARVGARNPGQRSVYRVGGNE